MKAHLLLRPDLSRIEGAATPAKPSSAIGLRRRAKLSTRKITTLAIYIYTMIPWLIPLSDAAAAVGEEGGRRKRLPPRGHPFRLSACLHCRWGKERFEKLSLKWPVVDPVMHISTSCYTLNAQLLITK